MNSRHQTPHLKHSAALLALAIALSGCASPFTASKTEGDVIRAGSDLAKGVYRRHCFPERSVSVADLETSTNLQAVGNPAITVSSLPDVRSDHGSQGESSGGEGSC